MQVVGIPFLGRSACLVIPVEKQDLWCFKPSYSLAILMRSACSSACVFSVVLFKLFLSMALATVSVAMDNLLDRSRAPATHCSILSPVRDSCRSQINNPGLFKKENYKEGHILCACVVV